MKFVKYESKFKKAIIIILEKSEIAPNGIMSISHTQFMLHDNIASSYMHTKTLPVLSFAKLV